MSGSITRSGTTYTLTLTDHTSGWTQTTVKTGSYANATAEAIVGSPTAKYPQFYTVTFVGPLVDGSLFYLVNPTALDASNTGGYEDQTSVLTHGTDHFQVLHLRE